MAIILFVAGVYLCFGNFPNKIIELTTTKTFIFGQILITISTAIFVAYILQLVLYRKKRYENKMKEEKSYYETTVKEFKLFYYKNFEKFKLNVNLKPRDRCPKENSFKQEEIDGFICDMSNVISPIIRNLKIKSAQDFIKKYRIFIEQIVNVLEKNRTCNDFSVKQQSIIEEVYEKYEDLVKLDRLANSKLKEIDEELNKFKTTLL